MNTSLPATTPPTVAVGEVVEIKVLVYVPEVNTTNVTVAFALPYNTSAGGLRVANVSVALTNVGANIADTLTHSAQNISTSLTIDASSPSLSRYVFALRSITNTFDLTTNLPEDTVEVTLRYTISNSVNVTSGTALTTTVNVTTALTQEANFSIGMTVGEPVVVLQSATMNAAAASVDGGDLVYFGAVIAHNASTSTAAAYALLLQADVANTAALAFNSSSVSVVCSTGCPVSALYVSANTSVQSTRLQIFVYFASDAAALPVNATLTVNWTAAVTTTVRPAQQIKGASLQLTYATTTPSSPGALLRRTYTALAINRTSIVLATVPTPSCTTLQLASYGVPDLAPPSITIHERLEFSVALTLPEATTNLSLLVQLPSAFTLGAQFEPGSFQAFVAAAGTVTQTGATPPSAVSITNQTLFVERNNQSQSDSVWLGLGTLVNTPPANATNAAPGAGSLFVINFVYYVRNAAFVTAGTTLTTRVAFVYDGVLVNTTAPSVLTVVMPQLTYTWNTPAAGATFDAEDVVSQSVIFACNGAGASAYNISFSIVQHSFMAINMSSLTCSSTGGSSGSSVCSVSSSYIATLSGSGGGINSTLTITMAIMTPGQQVSVGWVSVLSPTANIRAGRAMTATASGSLDSSPDTVYTGQVAALTTRTWTSYTAQPSVTITLLNRTITAEAGTMVPDETAFFRINVTLPGGAMDLTVRLDMPAAQWMGLTSLVEYIGNSVHPTTAIAVGNAGVLQPAAASFVFSFGINTINDGYNGGSATVNDKLSFVASCYLPRNLTAARTNSLSVTAVVAYDSGLQVSAASTFTVKEPVFAFVDYISASHSNVDALDVVTYGMKIAHSPAASSAVAYDFMLNYTIDSHLVQQNASFAACILPNTVTVTASQPVSTLNCAALGGRLPLTMTKSPSLVQFTLTNFLVTEVFFASFNATVIQNVKPEDVLVNNATYTFDSSPLSAPYQGRVYQQNDAVQTIIASPTILTTQVSSSDAFTTDPQLTIGEAATFLFTLTMPESLVNTTIIVPIPSTATFYNATITSVGGNIQNAVLTQNQTPLPGSNFYFDAASSSVVAAFGTVTVLADNMAQSAADVLQVCFCANIQVQKKMKKYEFIVVEIPNHNLFAPQFLVNSFASFHFSHRFK